MKPGTILRSYNYIGDNKIEQESIYVTNKSEEKINEVTTQAQSKIDELINESETNLKEKLSNVDSYIDILNNQYAEEISKLKKEFEKEVQIMKERYDKIVKDQEDTFKNYVNSLESDVKEILIDLFNKFFFKEYQDTSNLESIIHECLSQLEESKNIKISMHKDHFEKFKENHQDTVNMLLDNNIQFTFHTKDNLILEFKTECDCIEVNFNNQMENLKETLLQS